MIDKNYDIWPNIHTQKIFSNVWTLERIMKKEKGLHAAKVTKVRTCFRRRKTENVTRFFIN